ncbi:hypothetical protein GQ53DRAFT_770245 [Thozetella sp. PMI_491]|nr:hypothetical protein GQ53DRAFT_770245 [Thozetella sp. PMI_491]
MPKSMPSSDRLMTRIFLYQLYGPFYGATAEYLVGCFSHPTIRLPVGKAAERFLPDWGITLFGVRHSLNPGPFNFKEHMLMSILASVGKVLPSSRPQYSRNGWILTKNTPTTHWSRRLHPVILLSGAHAWSPISWSYLRKRYLAFWSKFNYILSAAFSSAIAIAAVIIFCAVSYNGYDIN